MAEACQAKKILLDGLTLSNSTNTQLDFYVRRLCLARGTTRDYHGCVRLFCIIQLIFKSIVIKIEWLPDYGHASAHCLV